MECVRCGEPDALGRAVVRDGALEAVLCAVCADVTLGHVADGGSSGDPADGAAADGDGGPATGGDCAICTGRARVRLPELDCLIERADGRLEWEAERTTPVLGLCGAHLARVTTMDAARPVPGSRPPRD